MGVFVKIYFELLIGGKSNLLNLIFLHQIPIDYQKQVFCFQALCGKEETHTNPDTLHLNSFRL